MSALQELQDAVNLWDRPTGMPSVDLILEAARRLANLNKDKLLSVVGNALYGWSPDEPNDATGLVALTEVREVTEAVWEWVGLMDVADE